MYLVLVDAMDWSIDNVEKQHVFPYLGKTGFQCEPSCIWKEL